MLLYTQDVDLFSVFTVFADLLIYWASYMTSGLNIICKMFVWKLCKLICTVATEYMNMLKR